MSEEKEIQVSFQIPTVNVQAFLKKIATLNRKAAKLSCEPITVKECEKVLRKEADGFVDCVEYLVEGQAPKIEGWEFVARLDHTDNGNVINTVPGKSCPEKYGHTGTFCDHCKTSRYRTKIYVLSDEKGEHIQVGRSCLKSFLGHADPLKVAAYFEMILDLETTLGGFSEGGRVVPMYSVAEILALSVMLIEAKGFHKSGTEGGSTKDDVCYYLEDSKKDAAWEAFVKKFCPTEAAHAKAKKILCWIDTLGESNYEHNLKVTKAQGFVTPWGSGLIVSAVWAYDKVQKEADKAGKAPKANDHVGDVNQRLDLELVLTRSTYLGTDSYGGNESERFVHNFEDAAGNVFCWFTKEIEAEKGDKITVRGTVKAHNDYQGRKQTVLTRCKIANGSVA